MQTLVLQCISYVHYSNVCFPIDPTMSVFQQNIATVNMMCFLDIAVEHYSDYGPLTLGHGNVGHTLKVKFRGKWGCLFIQTFVIA